MAKMARNTRRSVRSIFNQIIRRYPRAVRRRMGFLEVRAILYRHRQRARAQAEAATLERLRALRRRVREDLRAAARARRSHRESPPPGIERDDQPVPAAAQQHPKHLEAQALLRRLIPQRKLSKVIRVSDTNPPFARAIFDATIIVRQSSREV